MSPPNLTFPGPSLPPAYFVTEPASGFEGVTDAGRVVPIFHFQAYVFPVEGKQLPFLPESEGKLLLELAEGEFLRNTKQNAANLERIAEPGTECNGHGWVFTGGRFLIQDVHVLAILRDNRYTEVREARVGDLAIYTRDQMAVHSGLVRPALHGGGIAIASKWGPFGAFAHAPKSHPFAGECRYYRTIRRSHSLAIRRKQE